MEMMIPQCRAARALLGWTAAEMAERAQIGAATVRRFESGQTVQPEMVAKMATALTAAGIEFYAGGAVIKGEKKGARGGPKLAGASTDGGNLSTGRVGEQARAAIDDGIAALFETRKRGGKTGKLTLEDFRAHWSVHTAKELEAALGAAMAQAEQADQPRLEGAIAVLQAARLAHV